jgi:hypothetical protein
MCKEVHSTKDLNADVNSKDWYAVVFYKHHEVTLTKRNIIISFDPETLHPVQSPEEESEAIVHPVACIVHDHLDSSFIHSSENYQTTKVDQSRKQSPPVNSRTVGQSFDKGSF